MSGQSKAAVVIDNGGDTIKAGFAGDKKPAACFDCVVGVPKDSKKTDNDMYIGSEALQNRDKCNLVYPIERGVIQDWDKMRQVWNHTFLSMLRCDPAEYPVVLTEPPRAPKADRERMVVEMMETLGTPGFYVGIDSTLSLYASGRTTGLVLSCGGTVTHAVPVYEGYTLPHAVIKLEFAGREVTENLWGLINKRHTVPDIGVAQKIKEEAGYVAEDYEKELLKAEGSDSSDMKVYELPDGSKITVASERFRAPELLFRSSLNNLGSNGIHIAIRDSISQCDIDIRRQLYQNIILSGGTTMIPGLPERLQKEVEGLYTLTPVKVSAPPERKYSAWLGGSILAELSTFEDLCVSRADYDEYGPGIVHQKCA